MNRQSREDGDKIRQKLNVNMIKKDLADKKYINLENFSRESKLQLILFLYSVNFRLFAI